MGGDEPKSTYSSVSVARGSRDRLSEVGPGRFDQDSHANRFLLGWARFRSGDLEGAGTSFERVVELAPWWTLGIGWLAATLHLAGDRARAEALGRSLPPCRDAATYHAVAGNVDEMFDGLEVAWRQRDAFLTQIRQYTVFEPYVGDARFKSLLARMNLAI